ncbi:unnamed protein product [Cylindrotheca closterium]|uniref:Amino acid transporter transmembrane domain-containing protein n=1 Tax=Cylindrotheca closterium TaxID=2856 RepID=A0AAD2FH50_9STRA|nr:unnamed protein product [Cylindrotheca closterium]
MATASPATSSGDILDPDFESPNRKANVFSSTFNLSATIVGGGVLSLPLAFERCGIILGSILMVIAAIVTERSMYLLCLCARMTGSTSYGEVGKVAFGKSMEYFVSILLFVILQFALVAYMVLLQDIWTSVLYLWFPEAQDIDKTMVLLVILLIMSPFFVQDTLHALRYNCYVSFASVSILCLALCHSAFITIVAPEHSTSVAVEVEETTLKLWSSSADDVLFAFPIITLSFLGIFNALPIQNSLQQPTRSRIRLVLNGAIGSSLVLMLLFGLGGYLYARDDTDGNILNNISASGGLFFLLGRLGCGVTIMLAMAMILLPCRSSLMEVLNMLLQDSSDTAKHDAGTQVSSHVTGEETPLLASEAGDDKQVTVLGTTQYFHEQSKTMDKYYWWIHYTCTFGIVIFCYVIAIHVPGVAVVWSVCGSFLAFLIAFTLPCAFYLKLQHESEQMPDNATKALVAFSWFLLVTSSIAAIACTIQTTMGFLKAG